MCTYGNIEINSGARVGAAGFCFGCRMSRRIGRGVGARSGACSAGGAGGLGWPISQDFTYFLNGK
eukprot:5730220-Prymnesium_polylepis.1